MLNYDITQPPPARQELETEKQQLTSLKKRQIKVSLVSDACHAAAFLALYLTHLLSGYGVLVAISLATFVAVMLASSLKKQLRATDLAVVVLVSLATVAVVAGVCYWIMAESLHGALLAGLASGSIVVAGSVIGRRFFHVFIGLDLLRNVTEDEFAVQELLALCRRHPELEDYRQQARDILRPNLTLGELQAMREWDAQNGNQPAADTR